MSNESTDKPSSSATPENRLVLVSDRGPVRILTFNRPERMNAWTDALEDEYFAALDAADADPSVAVIVVTGEGRAFCAGADMDVLSVANDVEEAAMRARRPRHTPMMVRKPTIAAVNGAAIGLGLVEALYCDLIFVTPEAKIGTAFARRGLVAEYGIGWLLARRVGVTHANDLLLSARMMTGSEALSMNLANQVHAREDLLDAALAYADELATWCSPWSMATIKSQLAVGAEDFEQASELAEVLMYESFARNDVNEGVAAFVDKRMPSFAPLGARKVAKSNVNGVDQIDAQRT